MNSNGTVLGDYIPHEQLAVELGISLKTLENLNRAGDGPPRVKLGRYTYYPRRPFGCVVAAYQSLASDI